MILIYYIKLYEAERHNIYAVQANFQNTAVSVLQGTDISGRDLVKCPSDVQEHVTNSNAIGREIKRKLS